MKLATEISYPTTSFKYHKYKIRLNTDEIKPVNSLILGVENLLTSLKNIPTNSDWSIGARRMHVSRAPWDWSPPPKFKN